MPYASQDKRKQAQLKWASENRDRMNALKRKSRMRNSEYVAKIKGNTPCMDCGVQYPFYVMDFDHRGEEEKKCDVNLLVNRAVRLETLQAEIDKCDVVCSNCHRKRTWERHPTKYT